MTFQELSYPRRKNFIKNLNILLESKPVHSPQKLLGLKLLNQNSTIHSKLQTQRMKDYNILRVTKDNLLLPKKRVQQKVKNQQNKLKRKQNFKLRYSKSAHQAIDSPNKKFHHQTESLSPQYQSINRRVINTQGSHRLQIILNPNNQNTKTHQYKEMFQSSQFSTKTYHEQKEKHLFESVEIKRNSQGLLYDYKPKEAKKTQFLKKGHRIKINIIQNLIKSKLLNKYQQLNPLKKGFRLKEEQERLQNHEILKLIKLFKGTHLHQMGLKSKNTFKFGSILGRQEIQVRQKDSLQLQGWFNQSLSYQEHDIEANPKQQSLGEDFVESKT